MKPTFDHNLNEIQRLVWSCRRGMSELDDILTNFLRERFNCLNIEQKQAFIELLNYSDPDLFSFFIGNDLSNISLHNEVILLVRNHARQGISN